MAGMRTPTTLAAFLAAWTISGLGLAEPRPWRGPLTVRDQFPLELIALDFTPDDGGWLARGEWSVELEVVHANTFEISEGLETRAEAFEAGLALPGYDFVTDGETTRGSVRVDFGVGARVQLGLEVPVLHHDSGFLDSLIDRTHEIFGLPDNNRGDRPRDALDHDVIRGDERARLQGASTSLGDVVLSAKVGLLDGPNSALAVVVEAKAPTGDEEKLAGSGSWDFGLSVVGTGAPGLGRHVVHWGLGWTAIGDVEALPIDLDDKLSGFVGYEYRPSPRWSVVAQLQAESSGLPAGVDGPHDDPRAGLAVGFHHGRDSWQVSAGFIENLTTNDNTTDLGLFFSAAWRH
jgi:hypothetical protein